MIDQSQPEQHPSERSGYALSRLGWFGRLRLFWFVFAFALLVYTQFQFWKQPSHGDRANWDYFAQVISRGGVPYRDVVNIKSPVSAYIGAAAVMATRPFGLRDIFAIRITFIIQAAFVVAFTYLVTLDAFDSLSTALLAAALVLSFEVFSASNAGGTQPKTPMVLFGLVTLWAIIKDRPFAAGCFGMLSALCWQPGLLFVGTAGLAFSRYLTRWRDRSIARLLAGAIIPLSVLLAYFSFAGVLRDFYSWTIVYTSTVYAPHELRSVGEFFERISGMLEGSYHSSQVYFYLALIGLCIAIVREIRAGVTLGLSHLVERAPRHALMVAPIVYFGFCMIDIQGAADLIPLIPFVAVFAAIALVYALERLCSRLAHGRLQPHLANTIQRFAVSFVVLWVLFFSVKGALLFESRFPTLTDQDALVGEVVSQLEPGDKIFVHGQTEILVLGRLTNASKYFFFDKDKDKYLDLIEPGGFAGWFERLKAERPRIVALARLDDVHHAKDFLDWVAASYETHLSRVFTYYVRKDDIGRGESGPLPGRSDD
jgi:hypothetical protein